MRTVGKSGWPAKDRYQKPVDKANDSDRPDLAHNFGKLLAGVFDDYSTAKKYFTISIQLKNYDDATWRDLAGAYQGWADADRPAPDIQARLSPALQKAIVLSRKRLGKGNDFEVLLALADLHMRRASSSTGC